MLLVCDIGNSKIKFGIFDCDNLIENFSFAHSQIEELKKLKFSIDQTVFTSVVPEINSKLINIIESFFDHSPVYINSNSQFNLRLDYKTPETLGIDRLCGSEGAYHLFKSIKNFEENDIILSIDFGTATTINIIKYDGIFIGGLIAPGLKMMFNSLNEKTAQLPLVELSDLGDGFIGRSTKESIAAGVLNSTLGLIEKSIDHFKKMKLNPHIFITGGNADIIKEFFKFDFVYEKDLVLIGIKEIYKLNQKGKKI